MLGGQPVTLEFIREEPAPAWCADYVGLPYADLGRGPEAYDCWGLCWYALEREFGIKAPKQDGVTWHRGQPQLERMAAAAEIERVAEADFLPVPPGWEAPGDIIVLSIARQPLHVGLVPAAGWMLHTTEGGDSCLERYTGTLWRNRVLGFHRHRGLTA